MIYRYSGLYRWDRGGCGALLCGNGGGMVCDVGGDGIFGVGRAL